MKRGIVVLSVALPLCSPAHAAPGDPRLVQGILEWPTKLTVEPFLVIRTSDGQWLYTDVRAARHLESAPLTAGTRVTVLGREATRPFEITAAALGAGDAAALTLALIPYVNPTSLAPGPLLGGTPGPSSATSKPPSSSSPLAAANPKAAEPTNRKTTTTTGAAPSEPAGQLRAAARVWAWPTGTPRWAELQGTVDSVTDYTVTVRTDEGQIVLVDLSSVRSMVESFTPGLPVSVYGTPGESKFQAIGVILSNTRGPTKSPMVPPRR